MKRCAEQFGESRYGEGESRMYNILVCDDEKEIVDAVEIYLMQEGYRVFKAYDGNQALEIMKKEN